MLEKLKVIKDIIKNIDKLNRRIECMENRKDPTVMCSSCFCLIEKYHAIKGKSEIRERTIYNIGGPKMEEYVHENYYCRKCNKTKKE